ncbi:MAG: GldG family protein [Acidobacteriota bacterium]
MKRLAYVSLPLGLGLLVVASGWGVLAPRLAPAANTATMIVGAVLTVLGLWGRRDALSAPTGGRRVKVGASALASAAILVMLLLLINFFAARYHTRWDLTRGRDFSLHPATLRVLGSIEQDVDVYGFFTEGPQQRNVIRVVREQYESFRYQNNRIKVVVADPSQRPDLLQQLGVRGTNMTVVVCGERKVTFPGHDEADLAAALLEATRATNKTIYWLIGHGERELQAQGGAGHQRLAAAMQREYFQFKELALGPTDRVPDEAAALVLADPRRPLTEAEVGEIDRYLERGGRVLALVDADSDQLTGSPGPADGLLSQWGINPLPAMVFDPRSRTGEKDPRTVVGEQFGEHPAVSALRGLRVVMPFARPIDVQRVMNRQQIFHHSLVEVGGTVTPGASPYVETDLSRTKLPEIDTDAQKIWIGQPIRLAVAAFRKFEPSPGRPEAGVEARLVVVGDADFMADAAWDRESNGELAVNLMRWLTGEELLIRRADEKQYAKQSMSIEPEQFSTIIAVVIVLPLVVGLFGGVLWFARRSK